MRLILSWVSCRSSPRNMKELPEALPRSSQSPRKDMGLESRSLMNDSPMSCLDFLHTPTVEKTVQKDNRNNLSLFCSTSEWSTHCPEDPVIHKETKKTLDIGTRDNEEIESQKEQVIWRLERLLKDACIGSRLAGETQSLSDSVCTEDFVRRFKEEMVETAFSETNMQDMEIEDEAQWTEISNTDTFRNEQKEQSALIARRIGPVMTWKSSEATMIAHHSLSSKPCQRKELKRCLSENYRANMCMSHSSKKPGPEQRYKAPQTVDDDGSRWYALIQSVRDVDDHYTNQTDLDTPTHEEAVHKAQCIKRETCRLGCSYNDNNMDKNEEVRQWSSKCRTETKMEKLQKQRDSCVVEDGDIEKEPKTLSQHKQTIYDRSCMERKSIVMSVLEREEIERQLDGAKSELFAEQRRAREKLESMQEKLEETCEELQRATEAESSLRNMCSCLEEKQMLKQKETEVLEARVSELQVELGECKRNVATLKKMLGQKELQLINFQEHHGALQAERDGLTQELQLLKTQHCKALKEAQDQTHKMMKVQELEKERCAQQTEQESLLSVICKSLKEEHQAKLQRLQKQMAQDSQRTVLGLEQAVQLAEKEADRLRVMLEEREINHKQITSELDQQLRNWAQELGTECQHLHLLLEKSSIQLPPSPSVAEAVTNLRTLREQLKNLISYLQHELESQKQTTEQLRKDKERELSIQRQQLRIERAQAMDFLKERLIQEHIEHLSSLNSVYMSDGGAEEGGVVANLCKQLKSKDLELRQVKRNMDQWKQQTAARLACKFEEVLTAEMERKTSKTQRSDGPEGDMALSAKKDQNLFCSTSVHGVDSAASYRPSDKATFKLLRHLQSRVKQLRVENQAYTCSLSPPDTITLNLDLPGSFLTTITQGQNSAGIPSHSSTRTVSS
ncbi:trichohyalin isoform X2 [Channa argus]|uniref:trichohyalin isoform X2 n=1 Tax=Channa argus TaxID=215402 RepID=UPI003521A5E2